MAAKATTWRISSPTSNSCWHEVEREFGSKPVAGVFHSLSGLIAIRHALEHQHRWRALVLFDPPIYPRDGHPLRDAQQGDKDSLAVRARKRTERYQTPHAFAKQFARGRSSRDGVPRPTS